MGMGMGWGLGAVSAHELIERDGVLTESLWSLYGVSDAILERSD